MTDLPSPTVEVINNEITGESHVVISRDGKGKSYKIEGLMPNERIKGVVEKVIGDSYTAEWLP